MPTTVCTVTTSRAPVNNTAMFVNYHINLGVDHMFIFFDDPNDPGQDVLDKCNQVTCIRCDSNHWAALSSDPHPHLLMRQQLNAGIALEQARKAGFQWLLHIDVDELIYTEKPLKTLLNEIPRNWQVVSFPVMEAVPEKTTYQRIFQEVDLFKIHPGRRPQDARLSTMELSRLLWGRLGYKFRMQIARLQGCAHAFQGGYVKGHTAGKAAFRTNAQVSVVRNHAPVPAPGTVLKGGVASEGRLLHYYSCGFEDWKTKWLMQYNDIVTPTHKMINEQEQFRCFVEYYEKRDLNSLQELYKKSYFLSDREQKILLKLGLLKKIQLPKKIFSGPISLVPN